MQTNMLRPQCHRHRHRQCQQHLLLCSALTENITKEHTIQSMKTYLEARSAEGGSLAAGQAAGGQEILEGESLPVGRITGPQSAVADQ